ncbi:MAG: hypothetical protein VCA36_13750 [Opitutales bacterium]
MELTNYSAIDIRGQFLTAEPEYNRTLEDIDFARESTRLVRHSLKLDVLNKLLATATRMTDVLIPLATQRPGSS